MNLTGYADYSILPGTKKGRNAMKKIKNMNYAESVNAFTSFSKKHHIENDFDINDQIYSDIEPLLTNKENIMRIIYDIYCNGFMAGYKQNEKERKEKYNKHFFGSNAETHKKLAELTYNLPCGICIEYFYRYIVLCLNDYCPGIQKRMPAQQRKAFDKELELSYHSK